MTETIEKAIETLLAAATTAPVRRWCEVEDIGASQVIVQAGDPKSFATAGNGVVYAWQIEVFVTIYTNMLDDEDKTVFDSIAEEIFDAMNAWNKDSITGVGFEIDGILPGDSQSSVDGDYHKNVLSKILIVREVPIETT